MRDLRGLLCRPAPLARVSLAWLTSSLPGAHLEVGGGRGGGQWACEDYPAAPPYLHFGRLYK